MKCQQLPHKTGSLFTMARIPWQMWLSEDEKQNVLLFKAKTVIYKKVEQQKRWFLKKGKSDRKYGIIRNFVSKVCWHASSFSLKVVTFGLEQRLPSHNHCTFSINNIFDNYCTTRIMIKESCLLFNIRIQTLLTHGIRANTSSI